MVVYGDSISTDARDVLLASLERAGYDVPLYLAAYGTQLCLEGPAIKDTITNLAPAVVILQYQANNSYWGCVDGYDADHRLYDDNLRAIAAAASSSGHAGGTRVLLVPPLPNSEKRFSDPTSEQGATDAQREWAQQRPDVFTLVDPTHGLTPGPGALQPCYPGEDGCRPDGTIQVRDDYNNVITGAHASGGGEHLCPIPQVVSLSEVHCTVPNAGARRFANTLIDALRATV